MVLRMKERFLAVEISGEILSRNVSDWLSWSVICRATSWVTPWIRWKIPPPSGTGEERSTWNRLT